MLLTYPKQKTFYFKFTLFISVSEAFEDDSKLCFNAALRFCYQVKLLMILIKIN